jgi:glycine/D-amino acid oxidase-like deaminating enzyme
MKQSAPDLNVLVIDRNAAPAQGDTAKNQGGVRDIFTSDVNRLLAKSTIDFWRQVQHERHVNLNLDLVGYLWLLTESRFKAFEAYESGMRRQSIRLRTFEREELKGMIPDLVLDPESEQSKVIGIPSIFKGVQGLDCGTVSPDLVAKFYDDEFRKLGGVVELGTEAKSLCLVAKRKLGLPGEPYVWQEKSFSGAETNGGFIEADTIVLATGVRTPLLLDQLGVDCLIKPQKRQIFPVHGTPVERLLNTKGFSEHGILPMTILPRSGMILRPLRNEKGFWVQAGDGLGRPFGLEEEPMAEEQFFNRNIYPILTEYLPCFSNLRPVNPWAGFYDLNSVDSTPIIARVGNCIMAVGMSGSGLMKADGVGRVATAIFEGKEEATLFGDRKISTSQLGLTNRSVGKEELESDSLS